MSGKNMTISAWILFGSIVLIIAVLGFLGVLSCERTWSKIACGVVVGIVTGCVFGGMRWYFKNTASGQRALVDQKSDLNIVTIFPVSDMELLQQTVQNHQYVLDAGYYFEVISEEQAISLRDTLKAANDEAERQNALTPTDEDLYRASVLKLLTEIKMSGQGGEGNV